METSTKLVLGGAAALAALTLISGSRLQAFSKQFVLTTSARVQSINFSGLTLAIDIVFKNPTDASLKLKHPFITLFDSQASLDANEPLLSSTVENTYYTIAPNSETALKPVLIGIDLFSVSLALTLKDLVARYLKGLPVTLYGKALSQVNGTIPVAQTFTSTFQKNKAAKTVQSGAPKTATGTKSAKPAGR